MDAIIIPEHLIELVKCAKTLNDLPVKLADELRTAREEYYKPVDTGYDFRTVITGKDGGKRLLIAHREFEAGCMFDGNFKNNYGGSSSWSIKYIRCKGWGIKKVYNKMWNAYEYQLVWNFEQFNSINQNDVIIPKYVKTKDEVRELVKQIKEVI